MAKVEFEKAVEFEGTEYEELELDLESLKGKDISAAKKQWQKAGNAAAAVTMDIDFCIHVATMACDQPIEFFNELPAKEYNKVYAEVFSFLNS